MNRLARLVLSVVASSSLCAPGHARRPRSPASADALAGTDRISDKTASAQDAKTVPAPPVGVLPAVSVKGMNGVNAAVTDANTAAAITIGLGAISPASVSTGAISGGTATLVAVSGATIGSGTPAIVAGEAGQKPWVDAAQTIYFPAIQVSGADTVGNGLVGYGAWKYSNDGKGIVNTWIKTRGGVPNSFGAVEVGNRIITDYYQAGTGTQTGHAGVIQMSVDSTHLTAGEVAGRYDISMGSGYNLQAPDPLGRYGGPVAFSVNSHGQVAFWGPLGNLGKNFVGAGGVFGAQVLFPPGVAAAGYASAKWVLNTAALLPTPEPGAFEVDAAGKAYFTGADGVRRSFVMGDAAAPTLAVTAAAGSGAGGSIDASGSGGVVTIRTGAGSQAGAVATITYAHPFASTSYPVLTAANRNAALLGGVSVSASAAGFQIQFNIAPADGTQYVYDFNAPGR